MARDDATAEYSCKPITFHGATFRGLGFNCTITEKSGMGRVGVVCRKGPLTNAIRYSYRRFEIGPGMPEFHWTRSFSEKAGYLVIAIDRCTSAQCIDLRAVITELHSRVSLIRFPSHKSKGVTPTPLHIRPYGSTSAEVALKFCPSLPMSLNGRCWIWTSLRKVVGCEAKRFSLSLRGRRRLDG